MAVDPLPPFWHAQYTASRVPVLLSRSTSAPSPAPRALLCKIGAEGTDAAESVFYALDGLASLSPGVALDSAVAVASALASRAGRLALRGDNDVLTRALERFATGATARGREQRGGGFLVCAGCFLLCLTQVRPPRRCVTTAPLVLSITCTLGFGFAFALDRVMHAPGPHVTSPPRLAQPEVCPSLQLVPTFVQLAAAVLSGFLAAPRKSVESPGLSSREQATVTPLLEALQSRGVIPSNLSPQVTARSTRDLHAYQVSLHAVLRCALPALPLCAGISQSWRSCSVLPHAPCP